MLKVYKATSAGRRHQVRYRVVEGYQGVPRERRSTGGKKSKAGLARLGRVRGIQRDPIRTGPVARRKHRQQDQTKSSSRYSYVPAVEGIEVGSVVQLSGGSTSGAKVRITPGSRRYRHERPVGTKVSNVGGVALRAAGIGGVVVEKANGHAVIRVSQGSLGTVRQAAKLRRVGWDSQASIGIVAGGGHNKAKLGKAGRSRWLGRRPHVRGEAMNPVDHPHGGRTRGGRPELTPWSRRAKGVRTRRIRGSSRRTWL